MSTRTARASIAISSVWTFADAAHRIESKYTKRTYKHANRSAEVWEISRAEADGFPFAVVSINVTRWAMNCVRNGSMNAAMNKAGAVMDVANALYAQAMIGFGHAWKAGGHSMKTSGYFMKEYEKIVSKKAKSM